MLTLQDIKVGKVYRFKASCGYASAFDGKLCQVKAIAGPAEISYPVCVTLPGNDDFSTWVDPHELEEIPQA